MRIKRQAAYLEGFSLHAGVHLRANDREGLAHLCGYGARPPLAQDRLSQLPDGRLDLTGQDLMAQAFAEANPKLHVAVEGGQSGRDEQRGFKFLFMGATVGIRNPKGHGFPKQNDPRRTLEYLAFASLLMRRLDESLEATIL